MRIIWEVLMPGGHEPDVSMGLFISRDAAYAAAIRLAEKSLIVPAEIEERSYENEECRYGVVCQNGYFSIRSIVIPRELIEEG